MDAFQCPRSRIPTLTTHTYIIERALSLASVAEPCKMFTEARALRGAELSGESGIIGRARGTAEREPRADQQTGNICERLCKPRANRAADAQECSDAVQRCARCAQDAMRIAGIISSPAGVFESKGSVHLRQCSSGERATVPGAGAGGDASTGSGGGGGSG